MTRPIGVVMLTTNFYPHIGGAEKQALEVSKALAARGARVRVVTRRTRGLRSEDSVAGIPVRRLAAWGGGLLGPVVFMLSSLLHLLLRWREYDVLHVHLASSPAVSAALAGRILGKKVVVKMGGGKGVGEIARSRGSLSGRLKLWAIGRLRPTLVAVNREQARELVGFGLERLEVRLIPNGVDLQAYRPAAQRERDDIRRELGWAGMVFLFLGRFGSDKGQLEGLGTFLDGWSAARRNGFSGSFYMVGSGPEEARFREMIRSRGLDDCARLLGPREEVSRLHRGADVFVLPTLSEGLSNALLEALASGLPALACRVSGIREVVEHGTQGFLFDPSSPEEVERLLTDIGRDPARLRAMGRSARKLAASRFSLDATAEAWLEAYKSR
ncbi:MAG: glycosyltransferase family 4 protein [Elusimicrobiota bacterium]